MLWSGRNASQDSECKETGGTLGTGGAASQERGVAASLMAVGNEGGSQDALRVREALPLRSVAWQLLSWLSGMKAGVRMHSQMWRMAAPPSRP